MSCPQTANTSNPSLLWSPHKPCVQSTPRCVCSWGGGYVGYAPQTCCDDHNLYTALAISNHVWQPPDNVWWLLQENSCSHRPQQAAAASIAPRLHQAHTQNSTQMHVIHPASSIDGLAHPPNMPGVERRGVQPEDMMQRRQQQLMSQRQQPSQQQKQFGEYQPQHQQQPGTMYNPLDVLGVAAGVLAAHDMDRGNDLPSMDPHMRLAAAEAQVRQLREECARNHTALQQQTGSAEAQPPHTHHGSSRTPQVSMQAFLLLHFTKTVMSLLLYDFSKH